MYLNFINFNNLHNRDYSNKFAPFTNLIFYIMIQVNLSDLKKGELFTRKSIDCPSENQVFIRGDYERSSKKFSCTRFSDSCSEVFLKGSTVVFIDFNF